MSSNKQQLNTGNKLEYLYQIPEQLAHLPLLGSSVRALGKGWSVEVDFSGQHERAFVALKNLLTDPTMLSVGQESEAAQLLLLGSKSVSAVNKRRRSLSTVGHKHLMVSSSNISDNSYDLISSFSATSLSKQGVTAITGTGKGKTTTGIGLSVEQLVMGRKVAIIQWFKERKAGDLTWAINEHFFPELLKKPGQMVFEPMGLGFFGSPNLDRVHEYQAHKDKAYQGLELARKLIDSGKFGLVMLDEFVDTVPEISGNIQVPLIELADVRQFLDHCRRQTSTQVVVTGRKVTPQWRKFIGTSIVITEVKHPWSSRHAGAVSGLDF